MGGNYFLHGSFAQNQSRMMRPKPGHRSARNMSTSSLGPPLGQRLLGQKIARFAIFIFAIVIVFGILRMTYDIMTIMNGEPETQSPPKRPSKGPSEPLFEPSSNSSSPTPPQYDMPLFWTDYKFVMTPAADLEDWFDDTTAATRFIGTMFSTKVLRSHREEGSHRRMWDQIELRAKQARLAQAEFNTYITKRNRLIGELLSDRAPWRFYIEGRGLNDTDEKKIGENLDEIERKSESKTVYLEMGDESQMEALDDEKFASLMRFERQIIDELHRTQTELFEDWDPSHVHVREAWKIEQQFIAELKDRSTKGVFWTTLLEQSLYVLGRRMDGVQQCHQNMKAMLATLQLKHRGDPWIEIEGENRVARVREARELFRAWASLLMGMEKGMLLKIRQNDIKRWDPETTDYDFWSSWSEWKLRNCGGTSCFGTPGILERLKRLFGLGKPVVGVAKDELSWWERLGGDKSLRISRDVYEKACCENGTYAQLLRKGRSREAE
ncbi:hypothetical protein GGR50DRAFT_216240 [Xylaria sp. CBS 124048]|nr:hypothetical protein GGR50DRAFT_216240 [Xylaria sp. CBS 124048]